MPELDPETLETLRRWLAAADAVVVGAGAGLSASAGYTYSGVRFDAHFADFAARFGIRDMYAGGFYPFPDAETRWAWWSRHIFWNRYDPIPKPQVFADLLALVRGKDHFVLTTNVDHTFQRAGFDKRRLFYTQGDYGLWQCSKPCHARTYDNERDVRAMLAAERDLRIPAALVPRCPVCGREMAMNLRADDTFVQDEGWHAAAARYSDFLRRHERASTLFLDLGTGFNTPGIVKVPFWQMTLRWPRARYACINTDANLLPAELRDRGLHLRADIGAALAALRALG